jgi:hypothetical protein
MSINNTPPADESILAEALRITSGDRRKDYDHPTPNHERIAALWNAFLSIRKKPNSPISASEVAWMMALLKIARDAYTPKRDNYVDAAGYIRCAAIIEGYEEQ